MGFFLTLIIILFSIFFIVVPILKDNKNREIIKYNLRIQGSNDIKLTEDQTTNVDISNHEQSFKNQVNVDNTQKSQSDVTSDPYYKILDIIYENTKPIQGMNLNTLLGDTFFGIEGLEDIEGDLVRARILSIANSQKNLNDSQLKRLIEDLTPQKFKELMFLVQQQNSVEIVKYYNQLSKEINDRALVAMRVIAYEDSQEEIEKQIVIFDSLFNMESSEKSTKNINLPKNNMKNSEGVYEYESVTVNTRGEIIQRTPGRARYYRENLGNGVYLDMVYVAGGSFLMGSPSSETKSSEDERPQHKVTIPNFWIGKYQVTQAQWQAVMKYNRSDFRGEDRPVQYVRWIDCQEFCQKLSNITGKRYRLPSEAEWEYACRAGTTTPFNCGETITTDLANYDGDYTYAEEAKGQNRGTTMPVGSFPPNAWGLYDMHGNVWEWCEDGWHENYQGAPDDCSPWIDNHQNSYKRVFRGGSFNTDPPLFRSALRNYANSIGADSFTGFRLVMRDNYD